MYKITFLLFFVTLMACDNGPSTTEATEVKKEAPEKEQTNTGVPLYNFDQLEPIFHRKTDTTYVINFWATWCKPCVEELPYFEQLVDKYQGEKFKLILVSLDFPKQIEKKLIPFIQKHQLKGQIMVLDDPDANTWIPKVSEEWSGAIPATVVYNQTDRSFHEKSFDSFEELDEIIKPFVR